MNRLNLKNVRPSPEDGASFETELVSSLQRSEALFAWSGASDTSPAQKPDLEDLLRIHEYERQRLGQELHDSAGQLLVSLQLSVAHLRIVEGESGHGELFDEIQDILDQMNRQIRSLAFLHYPVELADRGLGAAIEFLAKGFARRTGIETSFKASGNMARIDETSATALLRIAQEALVNVHRHSHASCVSVKLRRRARSAELTVSDDGVGIAGETLTRARGIGLKGMRHRVEKLGGCFKVRNLKPGAEIYASVPVPA